MEFPCTETETHAVFSITFLFLFHWYELEVVAATLRGRPHRSNGTPKQNDNVFHHQLRESKPRPLVEAFDSQQGLHERQEEEVV